MLRKATTLVCAALAFAPVASAQYTTLWSSGPADAPTSYLTGSGQRGIAYVSALSDGTPETPNFNERLVVLDRPGGALVLHDPNTGAQVGAIPMPTEVSGGTLPSNDIEATDDGKLVLCNLAAGGSFKCYLIENESSTTATTIVEHTPSGSFRLGDKITVTGSTLTEYSIWVVDPTGLRVLRYSSADFANPTVYPLTQADGTTPIGSTGTSPAVAPILPDGSAGFYLTGNGIGILQFDATGRQVAALSTATVATGSNKLVYFNNTFEETPYSNLAVFEYNTSTTTGYHRAAILDVTSGLSTATLYGRTESVGGNAPAPRASSGGNGDIALRDNGNNTFTVFVLGTNNGLGAFTTTDAHLPVELASFDAVTAGTDVNLHWTTESEVNNARFEVERQEGSAWLNVGSVTGAGNAIERNSYRFTVEGLAAGTYVFRLKQVDFDGSFAYSHTVEATVGVPGAYQLVSAYPNPFQSSTRFALTVANTQQVSVEVFDALGRHVTTLFDGTVEAGVKTEFLLDGSGLAAGTYLYRVTGERFNTTGRVMLVK